MANDETPNDPKAETPPTPRLVKFRARVRRRMPLLLSICTVLLSALIAWWIATASPLPARTDVFATATAAQPEPNVGLTWYSNADPTVPPGVSAPLWQFLVRTDVPSLYYKSGGTNTAWTLIGAIPSPSTITGSGSAPDLAAWTGAHSLGDYGGSAAGCGSGSGVTLVSFDAKGSTSVTCGSVVGGIGSAGDVVVWTGSGFTIGDYGGSGASCGAGSGVVSVTINAQGSASLGCTALATGTLTGSGSAGDIMLWASSTAATNYTGSASNACGTGSAAQSFTLSAQGSASASCAQFVFGTGSSGDLMLWGGTGSATNYAGSASATCGAGSAVGKVTINAQGSASVTCVTAGTGTVTSTGSAGFLAQFSSPTNIQNWSGSGCSAGSAIQTIDGSGNITCITVPSGGVTAAAAEWGLFGYGGDGAITFDGTSTVTVGGVAMVPAGSAYTLGVAISATNVTINSGVTVNMGGYFVQATGTCTNNGTARDNGANATNGIIGTDGAGGPARASAYYQATGGGTNGGINTPTDITNVPRGIGISAQARTNGGTGGAAFSGGAGGNGAVGGPCQGGTGGGGGGATIAAAGGTAGSGGSITLNVATRGTADLQTIKTGNEVFQNAIAPWFFGGTGGTGGADGGGSSPNGAGGGAAGGVNLWYCRTMAGSGAFQAIGGNGGSGATGNSASAGAGGGGGGGGGGVVFLVYSHNTGTWTTSVAGGLGKQGGPSSGAGIGGSGSNGSSCVATVLNVSGDGT